MTTPQTDTRLEVGSDDWIDAAATLTRSVMLRHFGPRSCVAGAFIGREVLAYFGVAAEPCPVQAMLFSPEAAIWHADHGLGQVAPVGHSVGIGCRTAAEDNRSRLSGDWHNGRGDWDGHLVLLLTGRDRMVDLTIDQAHRPARGLMVPSPLCALLTETWPNPDEPDAMLTFTEPRFGTTVCYQAITGVGRDEWRQSNDWRHNSAHRRQAIGGAIRAIREVSAP